MNVPSGWELVLVLLVIVVVFGSKRLPDSARALGRSMRILKAETKGLHDDDTPAVTAGTPAVGQHLPGQQAQHLQAQPAQHLQAQPVQPAQAFGAGSVPVTPEVAGPTIEQQRQP